MRYVVGSIPTRPTKLDEKYMKNIILFDMDGTLTEPRKVIQEPMVNQLMRILHLNIDIGIVTGSPENYLNQQLGPFIDTYHGLRKDYAPASVGKLHLMPCNGTKYIFYDGTGKNEIVPETMTSQIGEDNFYELTAALVSLQAEVLGMMKYNKLALTGNFIQYRDSMINWSPIGRNANNSQRADFVKFDNKFGFRKEYKKILEGWLKHKKLQDEITVALGGSTSFDIYPTGWDKTYATTWLGEHTCWFVGDKCQEGGNDYHLYELLNSHGRSFETTDPAKTIEIIKEILNTLSPDSSAG